MPRQRTTYTAEFKLQAVRMITDQHLSVAEVARRLDVGENLLRIWAKAFRERGSDALMPSPVMVAPARPTTNCGGCGPRWSASGPRGIC